MKDKMTANESKLPSTHVIELPRVGSEWEHRRTGQLLEIDTITNVGSQIKILMTNDACWNLEIFKSHYSPHIPKPKKKVPVSMRVGLEMIPLDTVGDYYTFDERLFRSSDNNAWIVNEWVEWGRSIPGYVYPVESVEWKEVEDE